MNAERITSRQNPVMQHMKKLQASRRYRQQHSEFAGDGIKLLEEAIRWKAGLRVVAAADDLEVPALPEEVRLIRAPRDVLESVSAMQTPQGVLFVCATPPAGPLQLSGGSLILEGIQDPGNLGTILRTADALEVPVVLAEGCADPYSAKAVRASMGAVFRMPPQMAGRGEIAAYCAANRIALLAAALSEHALDIREADLARAAVIIGSEGQGISREFLQLSERQIVIPMSERCESLNAAVAAAIVMWQMRR